VVRLVNSKLYDDEGKASNLVLVLSDVPLHYRYGGWRPAKAGCKCCNSLSEVVYTLITMASYGGLEIGDTWHNAESGGSLDYYL
jgi:hypothetical protein